MKAILIDPYAMTVTAIEIDGGLKSIYAALDCSVIECPINYENGDTLYCDEDGWLKVGYNTIIAGFNFPDWSYAIIGKSLIVGTDDEGCDVDCKSAVDDFKNIAWKANHAMRLQGEDMGLI